MVRTQKVSDNMLLYLYVCQYQCLINHQLHHSKRIGRRKRATLPFPLFLSSNLSPKVLASFFFSFLPKRMPTGVSLVQPTL